MEEGVRRSEHLAEVESQEGLKLSTLLAPTTLTSLFP